jgi:hypothetical protein
MSTQDAYGRTRFLVLTALQNLALINAERHWPVDRIRIAMRALRGEDTDRTEATIRRHLRDLHAVAPDDPDKTPVSWAQLPGKGTTYGWRITMAGHRTRERMARTAARP